MKRPIFYHSLYIDPKGLRWLSLEKTKTGWRLAAEVHQPFAQIFGEGQFAGQSLSVDPIQAAQGSSQILNWLRSAPAKAAVAEALKKLPAKQKHVAVCFSEAFTIFRYFAMPKIEKVYWKKAIPIEARKHIPFALQECYYDWRAAPISVGGKEALGVVFGAMRRDLYAAAQEMLESAGLKCLFMDAIAFAQSRSAMALCRGLSGKIEMAKETILTVYLDLEQVQMLLFHHGVPVLTRSIYLADSPGRGSFVLERRKLDLSATLNFARSTLGLEELNRILLLSSSKLDDESLKNWASGLSEELGIKVDVVKPLKVVFEPGSDESAELGDWSELAAMGLALRGVSGELDDYELNLASQANEAPAKAVALKKIWMGTAVVGALSLIWAAGRTWRAGSLEKKAAQMAQKAMAGLPELVGKDLTAVQLMVAQRSQGIEMALGLSGPERRFYVTRILASLPDLIPAEAWLENVKFSLPEPGSSITNRAALSLMLSGKVEMRQDQAESGLVQEFFRNLKSQEELSKNFPSANVSFQKVEAPSRGFDPTGAQAKESRVPVLAFSMNFKTEAKQ